MSIITVILLAYGYGGCYAVTDGQGQVIAAGCFPSKFVPAGFEIPIMVSAPMPEQAPAPQTAQVDRRYVVQP